ncbi:hypothetical protein HWV62_9591, partial [Athelia sp. TMB]
CSTLASSFPTTHQSSKARNTHFLSRISLMERKNLKLRKSYNLDALVARRNFSTMYDGRVMVAMTTLGNLMRTSLMHKMQSRSSMPPTQKLLERFQRPFIVWLPRL